MEGKNVKVYTVVFSFIRIVADLHGLWRKKTFLSDAEVACADQAAKQLGVCWSLMKWKPTLWLHWTVTHGACVLRKYGSMYMFTSVPTERQNAAKCAQYAFNRKDMELDTKKTPEYLHWERWRDTAAPTAYGFPDYTEAGIMAAQYQGLLIETSSLRLVWTT